MKSLTIPIKIEKMVYGGNGLARVADASGKSKTVFVPFVLDGEEISARIVEEGRSFSRATLEDVVQPSPDRVNAPCPYFGQCGGCHYQHSTYEHQLQIKTAILRETLLRTAKFDWQQPIPTHSADPWNYRNRTRMKVRAGGSDFTIGYYRFASHQLLAVEQCPISSPLINRALAALWELGRAGVVPAILKEIEFFANAADDELLLELYPEIPDEAGKAALQAFWKALKNKVSALKGAVALDGHGFKQLIAFGAEELVYRTHEDGYHVRAGSFFQTNRHLTEKLVALTTQDLRGRAALDLYSGTGLFSLPLSRRFERVDAVESGPASYADLRVNAPQNVSCHRNPTEDFLRARRGAAPDLVVIDPPRAGLGPKVTSALTKMSASRIAYVSCDPSTLARDLRDLVMGGYKIESIDLIDLFPQTFHIETVVHLVR